MLPNAPKLSKASLADGGAGAEAKAGEATAAGVAGAGETGAGVLSKASKSPNPSSSSPKPASKPGVVGGDITGAGTGAGAGADAGAGVGAGAGAEAGTGAGAEAGAGAGATTANGSSSKPAPSPHSSPKSASKPPAPKRSSAGAVTPSWERVRGVPAAWAMVPPDGERKRPALSSGSPERLPKEPLAEPHEPRERDCGIAAAPGKGSAGALSKALSKAGGVGLRARPSSAAPKPPTSNSSSERLLPLSEFVVEPSRSSSKSTLKFTLAFAIGPKPPPPMVNLATSALVSTPSTGWRGPGRSTPINLPSSSEGVDAPRRAVGVGEPTSDSTLEVPIPPYAPRGVPPTSSAAGLTAAFCWRSLLTATGSTARTSAATSTIGR